MHIWRKTVWDTQENISRRDVVKWIALVWWVWVSTLVSWVLLWDSKALASQAITHKPDFLKEEDEETLMSCFENNDLNWLSNCLEKYWDNKQVVLDFVLTSIFFWKIIPKFLSWDVADAMTITLPAVWIWYSLSSDEVKHHFWIEMEEAWVSVAQMMLIVSLVEWVNVNIEKIIQENVTKKFDVQISEMTSVNSKLWKKLYKLWVEVFDAPTQEEIEDSRSVFEKNWKVYISKEVLLEIMPYLISWKNLEEIIWKLSNYSTKPDFVEIKKIILENVEKNWFWDLEESFDERREELNLLWEIFMHEVSLLTSFVFTNQLIFWLWQTTLIKQKIIEMWLKLEIIALNSWLVWEEAKKLSKAFVNLSISYLPNRMAWISDLWPFMAAKAKWWLPWILKMVDWVFPVVLANIHPYLSQAEEILKVSLGKKSSINNSFSQTFVQEFVPNTKLFLSLVLQSLKTWVDTLPFPSHSFSDIWSLLSKNDCSRVKVNKKNHPFVINSKKLTSFIKWDSSLTWFIENEYDDVLSECETKIALDDTLCSTYTSNFFGITNIKDVFLALKKIYETWDNRQREKINEIFREHLSKIKSLWENISQLKKEKHDNDFNKKADEILDFIKIFVEIDDNLSDISDLKEDFFAEIYSSLKQWKLPTNAEFPLEDLELTLKENTYKKGSLKSVARALSFNIEFLEFLFKKDKDLFEEYKDIFITNIINIETQWENNILKTKSYNLISSAFVYLKTYLSPESFAFFEENILSDTKMTQTFKESFDRVNNLWELYWNRVFWEKEVSWHEKSQLRKNFESVFWQVSWGFEKLIHFAEHNLWKNSFEIFQMIFLIQTPYVLAVRDTIARIIKKLPSTTPASVKEYFIWLWTYVISMFADNYVWLVVWVELAWELLWMDSLTAIEKFSKYAIYGWSKVVTWNSPNALFDSSVRDDFYFFSNFNPEIKEEKWFVLLWKINEKLFALNASKSEKWFESRKKELIKFIKDNDSLFLRFEIKSIISELERLRYSQDNNYSWIKKMIFEAIMWKISWQHITWSIKKLWDIWIDVWEVMFDVLWLQLMPSVWDIYGNLEKLDEKAILWNIVWVWIQTKSAWGIVNWVKGMFWKIL